MAVEEAKIIFVDNLVPDEINVVGLVELILFKVFVCKEVKQIVVWPLFDNCVFPFKRIVSFELIIFKVSIKLAAITTAKAITRFSTTLIIMKKFIAKIFSILLIKSTFCLV